MFRKLSFTRDRSGPNSPPSSPTRRNHAFYQHPSGSRFTEDSVSAVLSSETGSDATSLGASSAHSIPPWRGTQPSRLQKLRRASRPFSQSLSPIHLDGFVGDSSSEITTSTSTWTVRLHVYLLWARTLTHIHCVCIIDRWRQYQYQHLHQHRSHPNTRYRSVLCRTLRNRSQRTTGYRRGQASDLRSFSSAPSHPRKVSSVANSCTRPSLPIVMPCGTSHPERTGLWTPSSRHTIIIGGS